MTVKKMLSLLTMTLGFSFMNAEPPSPVGIDQTDSQSPESFKNSESVLKETHFLLADTIRCITKQIPKRKFDPKIFDEKLDREVDTVLNLLNRVQHINYTKKVSDNTQEVIKQINYVQQFEELHSDCLSSLNTFESDPENQQEFNLQNTKMLGQIGIPLYKKMFGTTYTDRSYAILSNLASGHAICENQLFIAPYINIALLFGIHVDLPNFKSIVCFDRKLESRHYFRQVGQLSLLATPGIMLTVGGGASSVSYMRTDKKYWPNVAAGAGIGVGVGEVGASCRALEKKQAYVYSQDSGNEINASGGLVLSPVGYSVYAFGGLGLNKIKSKKLNWENDKQLQKLIETFRDTRSKKILKVSEKESNAFFDFAGHTRFAKK